ncbi:MAG: cytochrome c biogenesis protein CcsA [Chloroflexi bacterium]|nr:cytochrome c biogenesis protein CcsA [Chloroflexota bacterium]
MLSYLIVLGGALMVANLFLSLVWSPPDVNLTEGVRIFYFHAPVAWVSFLAFFIVFVASILYLTRKEQRWDLLANASAEIGVLFATLMLISGSLFARIAWNVWWTWDPRLTTALILWFIYVGYLMLRAYAPQGAQGARYAAVLGIIGFVDVPIVYFSVRLRTLHPRPIGTGGAEADTFNLASPEMVITLVLSVLTFTLLFAALLWLRYRMKEVEEATERIRRDYA